MVSNFSQGGAGGDWGEDERAGIILLIYSHGRLEMMFFGLGRCLKLYFSVGILFKVLWREAGCWGLLIQSSCGAG